MDFCEYTHSVDVLQTTQCGATDFRTSGITGPFVKPIGRFGRPISPFALAWFSIHRAKRNSPTRLFNSALSR